MSENAPVLPQDVEPTNVDEVESALLRFRILIDEVSTMKDGVDKAQVVSGLYRAFQELTKELREMREVTLLDAAVELAEKSNEWKDKGHPDHEIRYFEPEDPEEPHAFFFCKEAMRYGFSGLMYRVNKTIWMDLPNGKRQILEPFTNEYEPERIARRMYDKVVAGLKSQRAWEAQYGKPHRYPKFQKYEDR